MKKTLLFILLAAASTLFAACEPPAVNTGANNANTNTTKPVAAAPTLDALMALDRQANEAYVKGDSRFFEEMLSDKFVILANGQRMDKATTVKMIAGVKCDIKSMDLTEPAMSMIDADTYALSYKATWDGTCNDPDGKPMKVPSPVRSASIWVRSGDKWQAVFHGENLIVDPKAPPPPPAPAAKKEEPKKDDKVAANSNTASNTALRPGPRATSTGRQHRRARQGRTRVMGSMEGTRRQKARRSDGKGRFICEHIRHLPRNQGRCNEGLDRKRLRGQKRQRHRWLRHGSFADGRNAHTQGHCRRHLRRSGDRRDGYLGRVNFC